MQFRRSAALVAPLIAVVLTASGTASPATVHAVHRVNASTLPNTSGVHARDVEHNAKGHTATEMNGPPPVTHSVPCAP